MSRIVVVRHGETEWHAENRFAGSSDIALTAKGHQQAERLAIWARSAGLAAIWSSPLQRARLTAEPAAQAAGLKLGMDERLIELDFGRGEGLTAAEMQRDFPAERAAFESDPVRHHLPGGENPEAAVSRGLLALHSIAAANTGGRSLVVAHNTLLRLVLCRLLGAPIAQYRTLFPVWGNGTLTELELQPQSVALHSFNVPLFP